MRVIIVRLTLVYHVGSLYGWSAKYSFRTIPTENRKSFAVYGDLGVVNAQSLARLQREAQLDYYDAILHVGDFAYGKHSNELSITHSLCTFICRYGCRPGNSSYGCNSLVECFVLSE